MKSQWQLQRSSLLSESKLKRVKRALLTAAASPTLISKLSVEIKVVAQK